MMELKKKKLKKLNFFMHAKSKENYSSETNFSGVKN